MNENKHKWYVNRLKNMSISEVAYRAYEKAKCEVEKISVPIIKNSLKIYSGENWLREDFSKFYVDLHDKNSIIEFFTQNENILNNIIKNAGKILKHRVDIFVLKDKFLGDTINWNYDYKNNISTPLKYWAEIDYKDFSQVGDIKYVWEVNRFQHIIVLAEAYYLTRDIGYVNEIKSQILSWIEQNPYNMGVNWNSSLELSIRVINWVWVYNFCKGELLLDEKFMMKFIESICLHLKHIYSHLSRYSSANNHLIGEAAGLVIVATLFPFVSNKDKYINKGKKILFAELYKQVYDDGVDKEQAISYQAFVLDFYLLSFLAMEINGQTVKTNYWSRIEKMCDFIAYTIDNNGNIPNIGDSDDGYVVKFSNIGYFNNYISILNTAAVLFDRPDFIKAKKEFDEKSFWLLGPKGYEKFMSLSTNAVNNKYSNVFDKGGYAIFQGDKEKIIFDCGSLGYLSIAAHGHADALSLNINYNNKNLIIDPGTYAYHTQSEWRDYFRSTSAHNTITVDGKNQSVIGGNFMWLQKANVRILDSYIGQKSNYISAEHDGYKRLRDPVSHKREILHIKNECCIARDSLYSTGVHRYDINWHLDQACKIDTINDNMCKISNGSDYIYMYLFSQYSANRNLISGKTNPRLGWQSLYFDEKKATNTISYTLQSAGNIDVITVVIFPSKSNILDDDADLYSIPSFISDCSYGDIKLEWKYNRTKAGYILNNSLKEFSYGGLCGKAREIYIGENRDSDITYVFAKDVESLYIENEIKCGPNYVSNIFEHSFKITNGGYENEN